MEKEIEVFVVYPDSVRLDLANKNKPVAFFVNSDHADVFAKNLYGRFYQINRGKILIKL